MADDAIAMELIQEKADADAAPVSPELDRVVEFLLKQIDYVDLKVRE